MLLFVQPVALIFASLVCFCTGQTYTEHDNSDYIGVYATTGRNWYQALSYCESTIGTTLASIHSDTDQLSAVDSLAFNLSLNTISTGSFLYAWIGAKNSDANQDDASLFAWTDGTTLDYQNWATGEPSFDGNCSHMTGPDSDNNGRWNDLPCTGYAMQLFICNKPPTMSPSEMPTPPTMSPTKVPSFLPTNEPSNEPSLNPSGSPTYHPTLMPSDIPTSNPSSMPSYLPTFEYHDNIYNESLLLNISMNCSEYNATDVSNSILLQKNVIYALKEASDTVRYDITDTNDIDISIVSILAASSSFDENNEDNNNNTMERRMRRQLVSNNDGNSNMLFIIFKISVKEESVLDIWIYDINNILIEFEILLSSYWNLSNDNQLSIKLNNIELIMTDTNNPTMIPTMMPSIVSTTKENGNNNEQIVSSDGNNDVVMIGNMNLSELSYLTIGLIIAASFFITFTGLLDAKIIRHNELFRVSTMLVVTMYLLDVVSDAFFAIQTAYTVSESFFHFLLFGLSVIFLVLPILTNFYQLHRSIQLWVTDIETRRTVQAWIQLHLRSLYAMCIVFGSAFSTIEICNSNLFNLSVFNMGLNRRQKALFKNERVYSTILLENVPQLIVQIGYSLITSDITAITVFATIFSVLSITLSLFEYISARLLLSTETVLIIKLDLQWKEVSNLSHKAFKKIENYRREISHELSKIIDIDTRLIELLIPIQTKNGMYITFHIRKNNDTTNDTITELIKSAAKQGVLSKIFYQSWKKCGLNGQNTFKFLPQIDFIETKELKPDMNLQGQSNNMAAVISLKKATKTNLFTNTSTTTDTQMLEMGSMMMNNTSSNADGGNSSIFASIDGRTPGGGSPALQLEEHIPQQGQGQAIVNGEIGMNSRGAFSLSNGDEELYDIHTTTKGGAIDSSINMDEMIDAAIAAENEMNMNDENSSHAAEFVGEINFNLQGTVSSVDDHHEGLIETGPSNPGNNNNNDNDNHVVHIKK